MNNSQPQHMTHPRGFLGRSVSTASSIHARMKRKISQRLSPGSSTENHLPPGPLKGPPSVKSSRPASRHPPSSYHHRTTPSLSSSQTSSTMGQFRSPSKQPSLLFRIKSRASDHPVPRPSFLPGGSNSAETTDEDSPRKPPAPRGLPMFYNLDEPSALPAGTLEPPALAPKRRRRHNVRRSINKVSDILLGQLLGHKRNQSAPNPTQDHGIVDELPQIARLSFASDASTGTLARYLAVRKVKEMYEPDKVIGMSIFAYECNGSWIREHEQKYQEAYMCLDTECEAHHGRMSTRMFQKRKAEEKVWFN